MGRSTRRQAQSQSRFISRARPKSHSNSPLPRRALSAGTTTKFGLWHRSNLALHRSYFERLEARCVLASSVVINEFLASNAHGIFDSDGAHSDWIELRNTSTSAVNIGGWYLTDDS